MKQINSLGELDSSTLTYADIRCLTGTFRIKSTGSGREKKCSSRNGVQTPSGDIEVHIWSKLAELLIQREQEEDLLSALIEWYTQHNYCHETKSELHRHALRLHVDRIFDNPRWIYYIPFNMRYRPQSLAQASLVTVVTECCGEPGEVTQEQVDAAYHNRISCPHCGRGSYFSVLSDLGACPGFLDLEKPLSGEVPQFQDKGGSTT